MIDDPIQKARTVFQKVNAERGVLDNVTVALGNSLATYITLGTAITRMGLISDPRVKQAADIKHKDIHYVQIGSYYIFSIKLF